MLTAEGAPAPLRLAFADIAGPMQAYVASAASVATTIGPDPATAVVKARPVDTSQAAFDIRFVSDRAQHGRSMIASQDAGRCCGIGVMVDVGVVLAAKFQAVSSHVRSHRSSDMSSTTHGAPLQRPHTRMQPVLVTQPLIDRRLRHPQLQLGHDVLVMDRDRGHVVCRNAVSVNCGNQSATNAAHCADQQPQSPQDWEHRLAAARKEIVKTIRFAANSPPHAPDLHLIHNTCQTRTDQQPT